MSSFSPSLLTKAFSLPRRQNSGEYEQIPDGSNRLSSVIEGYDEANEDGNPVPAPVGPSSSSTSSVRGGVGRSNGNVAWKGVFALGVSLVAIAACDRRSALSGKRDSSDRFDDTPPSKPLRCVPPSKGAAADLVKTLPGWTDLEGPNEPNEMPSCQYSGLIEIVDDYMNKNISMHVHYYFIEAEEGSEGGDDKAVQKPLILWSNGGPGASSMYGMMTEVGPFVLNELSQQTNEYKKTGIPTLFRNHYSWTKLGHLVMFDWPPPVGFSYCHDDIKGDGKSCGDWNDDRMARVSFLAMEGFLERFPDIVATKTPVYLTGESYAGIYVPKLAQQIVQNDMVEAWNLKGFAVGDACTGTDVLCGQDLDEVYGHWWDFVFLYGHGQFSNKLWEELMDKCGKPHLQFNANPPLMGQKDCELTKSKVRKQVGGFWAYNVYDECTYSNDVGIGANETEAVQPKTQHPLLVEYARNVQHRKSYAPTGFEKANDIGGAVNDYVCGEGIAQDAWTNHKTVRAALNVDVDSNFFSGDNGAGMVYTLTERNLMPFYREMVLNTTLRVMVYNGDTDPGLNSFTSQNWTSHLGLTETREWHPWTLDNCRQMGGYRTQYEGDFDFVTIRGSGHMVPHYKPAAAFELMSNYIRHEPYKVYDATCVRPDLAHATVALNTTNSVTKSSPDA